MSIRQQWDREEEALQDDVDSGAITQKEADRYMADMEAELIEMELREPD